MGILTAVTSRISWAPLSHLPAARDTLWNEVQAQLSALTPAIRTGTTASLCAKVTFIALVLAVQSIAPSLQMFLIRFPLALATMLTGKLQLILPLNCTLPFRIQQGSLNIGQVGVLWHIAKYNQNCSFATVLVVIGRITDAQEVFMDPHNIG